MQWCWTRLSSIRKVVGPWGVSPENSLRLSPARPGDVQRPNVDRPWDFSVPRWPNAGGQPSDLATLTSEDGATVFQVVHAGTTKDCPNVVEHRGYFVSGSSFSPGSRVDVTVDGDARRLHARLHSAGHLLDAAMRNVGRGNLEPSKGNHNPGGVAFVGAFKAVSSTNPFLPPTDHLAGALSSYVTLAITHGCARNRIHWRGARRGA